MSTMSMTALAIVLGGGLAIAFWRQVLIMLGLVTLAAVCLGLYQMVGLLHTY